MPGLPSKALSPDQIARLKAWRRSNRYSLAQLNRAMASSFRWQTLARALEGKPVWEFNHEEIVRWIDKWAPAATRGRDYKSEAAGDREDLPEPPIEAYDAPSKAERLRSERGKS